MLGDQPTAATATLFLYTRTGLMYAGQPMVAAAQFSPLLWSNTSALPGTTGNTSFTLLPTGEAAPLRFAMHSRQHLQAVS